LGGDAGAVVGVVGLHEFHRAGEGQRHRPEPHTDLALVGAIVDHLGEFGTGHAGHDAPDVHQHPPGIVDRQRHLEGIIELHDRSGWFGATAALSRAYPKSIAT
jgi:hypothetical protein